MQIIPKEKSLSDLYHLLRLWHDQPSCHA